MNRDVPGPRAAIVALVALHAANLRAMASNLLPRSDGLQPNSNDLPQKTHQNVFCIQPGTILKQ